jgi:hypothetical protein
MPPRGNTPGLKRGRRNLRYWIARQVVRDTMGFPDPSIPLPREADDAHIAKLCQDYTARLKAWIDEQNKAEIADPVPTKTRYDGSVLTACRIYQEHPLSDFHSIKHNTRATYSTSLRLIENTVGKRLIRNLTVLDVKNWYRNWRQPATPGGPERIKRAHDAISMFRTVMWFMTSLRKPECKQLAEEMSAVKFEKSAAREQEITYSQVVAFVRAADNMAQKKIIPAERALYMSIAVAAQFELMLRQADIIGQWAPLNPAPKLPKGAPTLIEGAKIWSGFFTWELIPGWRWRMKTSKSKYRAGQEFTLSNYELLLPLLEAVPHTQRHGAIVKGEHGLPVRQSSFGKWFRQIARAANIPDDVWNMDARAGGATEADEAGADIGLISFGLTHTNVQTTERYIRRRSARKTAELAAARKRKRAAEQQGNDQ